MWEAVAAGVAMFFLDFVYAEYTKAIGDRRPVVASSWASVLILLTGIVTTTYVGDPWMLAPISVGAFAGTYVSVKRRLP